MALKPGTQLGPYEIVAPLGAGGMGEVYRAKDTRLDRTVAVKVLPSHADDRPEARERFEREARAVSRLSHPNICTLFDVGTHEGSPYLVMEHLEGETLASRLEKGALPPAQILAIAVEIASALDRAHRSGIVHRDFKPGNIILTKSGAKLLDFGLAKQVAAESSPAAGLSTLRTEHRELTAEGTILGTFQYMAPEQLEGKEADGRTDIFAFGAVLYEMATGRKAFTGKSQASLIASILAADPPSISSIQPMTPQALDRAVRRCLAKEPDDRWQSAADLTSELRWIAEGGSQAGIPAPVVARRRSRERAWMSAAILSAVAAAAFAAAAFRPGGDPSGGAVLRFTMAPPEKSYWRSFNSLALSPDGRRLVFYADDPDGVGRLYFRPMDSLTAQPLPGTEVGNPSWPFWSPDSRFVGFFAGGKLKKIDVSGGPPQTLCDAPDGAGGTWNRDGVILFSPRPGSPIHRIPASGGEAAPASRLQAPEGKESHMWPSFLPDGRHFTYLALGGTKEDRWIRVGDLGSEEDERLMAADSQAIYSRPGSLLFVRGGSLLYQPFDAAARKIVGDSILLDDHIGQNLGYSYGAFSASETGTLVYRTGGTAGKQQTWFDRSGRPLGVIGPAGEMADPEISPDGKRVAMAYGERAQIAADVWLLDLARGTSSRFSFDPSNDSNPIWSADGTRIYFVSHSKGHDDIYQKLASGAGDQEPVYLSDEDKSLDDVSRDARFLAYGTAGAGTGADVFILPLEGDRKPRPLLKAPYNEGQARFSPDGSFLAYVSDETGKPEVYVLSFPAASGKWQISTKGGFQPQWRRDGREIFYLAPNSRLMAVPVKTEGTAFEAGMPVELLETGLSGLGTRNHYSVTADGQRILVGIRSGGLNAPPLTFVLNWPAGWKR